jgi:subtilase family serine protease
MRRYVLVATLAVVVAVLWISAEGGGRAPIKSVAICPTSQHGWARCYGRVVADDVGAPDATASPAGLSPTAIASAYGFTVTSISAAAGSGRTIAIVGAYDDPTAENDLGVFSNQFGLPACTTANGCFTKVNQTGGTVYPQVDVGWALETSLDVQWAHALAPGAKILLVEANSVDLPSLLTAEDYAKAHAGYVSNSWGGAEQANETTNDSHFVQPGVSFFVAAGDTGLPASYPSASPNVISVGGTTLNFSGGTFSSETGWPRGGGGCSAYETAASAQSSFPGYAQVNCGGKRATPDVSFDADPASGVSVYDSTPDRGATGWFKVGGTSAATPMWAAFSADAGIVVNAATVYGSVITYRDITSGNNGAECTVGFDLCSGRGSWIAPTPPPTTP